MRKQIPVMTRAALSAAVVLAATGTPAIAFADRPLMEIVVTAQKREERLQDVGIAATAFTDEELRALRFLQPVDIAAQTPALEIRNTLGNSNPVMTIRGVGSNDPNTNVAPSAALHVDEVYLGTNGLLSFQLFDLERVEVLKGPQGTLFGRNTTAGSVNFVTRKPTETFEAYLDATYGRFNTWEVDGAVSGPISEQLQGRLAFMTRQSDGHQTKLGTIGVSEGFSLHPAIPPVERVEDVNNFGGADVIALRGSLAWQPADQVDVGLTVHYSDDRSDQWISKMVTPDVRGHEPVGGKDDVFENADPQIRAEQYGGRVRVDWALDNGIDVVAITAYERLQRLQTEPDFSPFRINTTDFSDDWRQLSQEIRFSSSVNDRFIWTAGAFWMTEELDFFKTGNQADFILTQSFVDYVQDGDSWALFGQGEWWLNDSWKLTAGLRYSDDQRSIDGSTIDLDPWGVSAGAAAFPELPVIYDRKYSTTDLSGKVALDWSPSDDLLIYGSIGKGFKSGGFDGSTILTEVSTFPFDEEVLWAYELGFKSTLTDTLQLNGAVYYYDFQDMQVTIRVDAGGGVVQSARRNAGEAELYGGELELWWQPTAQFSLKAGLALLDSEIKEWDSVDPVEVAEYEGNRLADAPEVTFNFSGRYEWPLGNGLHMAATVDGFYSDEVFKEISNEPQFLADSHFILNGRLELTGRDDRWYAALWAQNITDKRYATSIRPLFGTTAELYNMPRTYGLSVGYRWQ